MSTASAPERTRDVLALVAHDEKKDTLTDFCVRHRDVLAGWDLIGTGSTAERISEATGLPVEGLLVRSPRRRCADCRSRGLGRDCGGDLSARPAQCPPA